MSVSKKSCKFILVLLVCMMQSLLHSATALKELLDIFEYGLDFLPDDFKKGDLEKIIGSEQDVIKNIKNITDAKKLETIFSTIKDSLDNTHPKIIESKFSSRETLVSIIETLSENDQQRFYNIIGTFFKQFKIHNLDIGNFFYAALTHGPKYTEQLFFVYPENITAKLIKTCIEQLNEIQLNSLKRITRLKLIMGNGDINNLINPDKTMQEIYTILWPKVNNLTLDSTFDDLKKLRDNFFYSSKGVKFNLYGWGIQEEISHPPTYFNTIEVLGAFLVPLGQFFSRLSNVKKIMSYLAKSAHAKGINLDEAKKLAKDYGLEKIEEILEDATASKNGLSEPIESFAQALFSMQYDKAL